VAILATDAVRDQGGGFSHGGGNWIATKLFLQRGGTEAEVFFNFDPVAKKGEFTEKDEDYADPMLAFLAAELRDGPRPRRTPETDPNLSAVGPKVDAWQTIAPAGASAYGFLSPSRYGFTTPDGSSTRLMVVPLDRPDRAFELFRTDYSTGTIRCTGDDQTLCLVEEVHRKNPNVYSSDDPRQFVLVDRKQRTRTVMTGAWGEKVVMLTAPFSPDASMIAIGERRPRDGGKASWVAHLVARAGSARVELNFGDDGANVIGWVGSGGALRAIVRVTPSTHDKRASYFWVDPRTGLRVEKDPPPGLDDADEGISPDGRHRVECRDDQVVVTDLHGGASRAFQVHADDRDALDEEDCVGWAGSRYLRFDVGARTGFIDIQTMKMSYMFEEDDDDDAPEFSADFRWAIRGRKGPIRAARVVVK
jgi:hypothetical protein